MFCCESGLGVIATVIGATNIPTSISQCWEWCESWLPMGKKFHLWGISAICWAIWKARNRACFDGRIIRNPIEILCHAAALMCFWTGIYAEIDSMMLINGVNTMLKVASDLLLPKRQPEEVRSNTSAWSKMVPRMRMTRSTELQISEEDGSSLLISATVSFARPDCGHLSACL